MRTVTVTVKICPASHCPMKFSLTVTVKIWISGNRH
jgi:hypothetical protein